MNTIANQVKQRLSLRQPLKDSLDILAQLADQLALDKRADLAEELAKVKALYPSCTDFERAFPSLAFSIATGVGKTRLMGAFIAYLHLAKGVRNFFILAPNLTIYEKLIQDFSQPSHAKYVFKGIAEFAQNPPTIITGENYEQVGHLFDPQKIRINIFNISKFNRDTSSPARGKEKDAPPRIKRFNELLGTNYWKTLQQQQDLVLLMDEAHRYHASSSMKALNSLRPLLGLELTATPFDLKDQPFRNVVYEYSLARALVEGKYVKNPAIATRKDFKAKGMSEEDIERIKLEDAVSVHRDTKVELERYARERGAKRVKPFILVVCRDIEHAEEVLEYVESPNFYSGYFKGKALQIDSSTKDEDLIARQFLSLEHPDNPIEIVIHVNMLKEGWDVSNLYTIVPLRAAKAPVLIEQTMGRGLRLPFNAERTGVETLDKLTIMAHENFAAVINAAENPSSVLNKLSLVELDPEELSVAKEAVTTPSKMEENLELGRKDAEAKSDPQERAKALRQQAAKERLMKYISQPKDPNVRSVDDLLKPSVKEKVLDQIRQELRKDMPTIFDPPTEMEQPGKPKQYGSPEQGEESEDQEQAYGKRKGGPKPHAQRTEDPLVQEAEEIYQKTVLEFKRSIIEIPRLSVVFKKQEEWFEDFDLDLDMFQQRLVQERILVVNLKDRKTSEVRVQRGAFDSEKLDNQIVSDLVNYPELDSGHNSDLLQKLANQVLDHLRQSLPDPEDLPALVRQNLRSISNAIYRQVMEHHHVSPLEYDDTNDYPFGKIHEWNYTTIPGETRHFSAMVRPVRQIPRILFTGFQKACHSQYKFDSQTEQDLANVLESDGQVLRWLRPAPNQFNIYWGDSKHYQPDFVVETPTTIHMVETKASKDMEVAEVLQKQRSARRYCAQASKFTAQHGGKPWEYVLIPDTEVSRSSSWAYLSANFVARE